MVKKGFVSRYIGKVWEDEALLILNSVFDKVEDLRKTKFKKIDFLCYKNNIVFEVDCKSRKSEYSIGFIPRYDIILLKNNLGIFFLLLNHKIKRDLRKNKSFQGPDSTASYFHDRKYRNYRNINFINFNKRYPQNIFTINEFKKYLENANIAKS